MCGQGEVDVADNGHLLIGGCDTVELAKQFGTPLIVYDQVRIQNAVRSFHRAFAPARCRYRIAYAVKAFCSVAMCQLIRREGAAVEVVSGTELYTALRAGIPPNLIHMHGNNKTMEELSFAINSGIHSIAVDNFDELSMLSELAVGLGRTVDVQLRVSPNVEAATHDYIATGQQDSKFGFDLESGQAHQAMRAMKAAPGLRCIGLHSHIGSQIFESDGFSVAIERIGALYRQGVAQGLPLAIFNVGGGFGIRYTDADKPGELCEIVTDIVQTVRGQLVGLPEPEIWVEPGRAIAGNAGVTLYRAGSRKCIPGVRNYISVDGGMTDNPRNALYGAEYDVLIANRASDHPTRQWAVVGKCCESGDVITPAASIPDPEPGDVLAVFTTGAYNYSMASHYNRLPHPAVVFVENGTARMVVRRETWQDVCRYDLTLTGEQSDHADDIADLIGVFM